MAGLHLSYICLHMLRQLRCRVGLRVQTAMDVVEKPRVGANAAGEVEVLDAAQAFLCKMRSALR